ncbi:MAG: hypothetical protein AAF581_18455 [Planctomycetota bacterium]
MRLLLWSVVVALLLSSAGFGQDEKGKYTTKSHLNKVAPELALTPATPRANADKDLTLKSLRGRLVLLLFTSTG